MIKESEEWRDVQEIKGRKETMESVLMLVSPVMVPQDNQVYLDLQGPEVCLVPQENRE